MALGRKNALFAGSDERRTILGHPRLVDRNLQDERCRSARLARRRPRQNRQPPSHEQNPRAAAVGLHQQWRKAPSGLRTPPTKNSTTNIRLQSRRWPGQPVSPAPSFQQIQTLTCGKRQGRESSCWNGLLLGGPQVRRRRAANEFAKGGAKHLVEHRLLRRYGVVVPTPAIAPVAALSSSNLLLVPTVQRGLSEPPYQDAKSLNMPPDVQSSAVAGPLDHCKRNGGRPYPCQPQPAFGIYQNCVNRRGSTIKIYPIACL